MSVDGYIDFKGHQSWYHVAGSLGGTRTPLLLLHGGPGGTSDLFEPLDALGSSERAVIRYDQLGGGRSDRPNDPALWTIETFVEELQAVRDQLGLHEVHLLGHSWGGMLALEYLLTRPRGVRSLILASSLASTKLWEQEALRLREDLPSHIRGIMQRFESTHVPHERRSTPPKPFRMSDETIRKRAKTFAKMSPVVTSAPVGWIAALASRVPFMRRAAYEIAGGVYGKRHGCRKQPVPIELFQMFVAMGRPVYEQMWGPSEFFASGTLKGWDVTSRLNEVNVPTLITSGRYDESTPKQNEIMRDAITGAEWVVFEDSAHCAPVEEPDRFRSVVEDFISRYDA